jgi:hypothetical protein
MPSLLYSRADDALPLRHQSVVGLGKLRLTQAIKRIIEMNLKRAAPCRPVSHAF